MIQRRIIIMENKLFEKLNNEDYKLSQYNLYMDYDKNHTFVFNTVNSAGALIEKYSKESILSEDDKKKLIRNNFIVPNNLNEYNREIQKTLSDIYNTNTKNQLYVIALSMECNANCIYCFEKDKRIASHMTDETIEKTIHFIKSRVKKSPNLKSVSISYFGGEPTLQLSTVKQISSQIQEFLKSNNIKYFGRIITNGILLSESNIIELLSVGVNSTQITIDGLATSWSRKKGLPESLYETVINNICNATRLGMKVNLRVNVDNSNKEDIPELMKFIFKDKELNGKIKMYIAPISKWNNADINDYISNEDFLNKLKYWRKLALDNNWEKSFTNTTIKAKTYSCGLIRNDSIGIRYDGKLYRCEHCFANDSIDGKDACIGTLEDGLYYNEIDHAFKQETLPKNNSIANKPQKDCPTCAYYPLCHGGCRMEAIINKKDIDCEFVISNINDTLQYNLAILHKIRKD